MHRGAIKLTIARVLAAETVALDGTQCAQVDVLPRVDGRSAAQVRAITRRAVLAVDPAAATGPDDPRGVDARRADTLVAVFTALRDTGTATCHPAGRLPTNPRRRARADVIAATTLLGLDQQPGELPGYGPIPADLAWPRPLPRWASECPGRWGRRGGHGRPDRRELLRALAAR